ncbi:putative DNA-binding pseudobarrel domain superfamily [Helianthus anomalus]
MNFTYRSINLYCIWLKVHQDDVACKLWGVDKCPTNVMIHTEYSRLFNVSLSASKGKLFFFHGWSKVVEHLRLTRGCLVVFNPLDSTTFKLTYFVDGVSCGSFWTYLLPPSSHFYADVAPIDAENEVDEQIHGGVRRFVRMAGDRYFSIPGPVSRIARLVEGLKDITVRLMHLDPPQEFTNGTRRERKTDGGWRYALTSWKKFMKAARMTVFTILLMKMSRC